MNPEVIKNLVFYVCIFFVGILTHDFFHLDGWSLKKEIDPLQVFSIILSLFIVIYISIYLENSKDRSKIKKEIIIKKIDLLIVLIYDLLEKVGSTEIKTVEAASMFKVINTDFQSFEYFMVKSDMTSSSLSDVFLKKHRSVNRLATRTPPKSKNLDKNLHVKDGRIVYSNNRVREINAELKDLARILIDEQIRVIDM